MQMISLIANTELVRAIEGSSATRPYRPIPFLLGEHLRPSESAHPSEVRRSSLYEGAGDELVPVTFVFGRLVYNHGGVDQPHWRVYKPGEAPHNGIPAIMVACTAGPRPVVQLYLGVVDGDLQELYLELLKELRPATV